MAGTANIVEDRDKNRLLLFTNTVQSNYFSTLGIRLTRGGMPAKDAARDASGGINSLIITERAAIMFLEGDPIGQTMEHVLGRRSYENKRIVGIAEDFNAMSLKRDVGPQVIEVDPIIMIHVDLPQAVPSHSRHVADLAEGIVCRLRHVDDWSLGQPCQPLLSE